ncbi:hypothetical protein [Streptomyces alkaliphilus]|uniref:hypothetical protein n=1 Tax=Streptomyces alkaliphilus TaxID=1472722 RepID=UPI00117E5D79|nr:hypothetical protein [Streptomyces alkaliphilus]MQS08601.1 hypothetical protein [Streptomyces alkaliphilus]
MAGKQRLLIERKEALRAVRALIRADYPLPAAHRRPLVLVQGGRGSGKTVLINVLAEKLDQHVPYGRIDFATRQDDVPRALSEVAGQLTRYRPRYRRLRFPRLLLGLLVIEEPLDHNHFERARTAVEELMAQRRSTAWPRRFLRELTGEPADVEIRWGLGETLVRLPLNILAILAGRAYPTFPVRARRWYGHRDRGLNDRAVDTLVDLNARAREAQENPIGPAGREARERVDRLLCEAFLADLRDCPRRLRTLHTPLLLLDNADTPAGRAFLWRLQEAAPELGPADRPEPLVVVATARDDIPGFSRGRDAPLTGILDGTSPTGPVERLSYRLPDLTRTDVRTLMSRAAGHQQIDRRLARLVHEFTGGHPEAVGRLAVASADPPHADSVAELLERPVAKQTEGAPTIEEWLLDRLLPGGTRDIHAFATCAAARREADGLWLSHQEDLVDPVGGSVVRTAAPWNRPGGEGDVLRRLSLRRLAARARDDRADWRTVHERLRDRCRETGDRAGELHHGLAMGELTLVVEELTRLLSTTPGSTWLELVHTVARAPLDPVRQQSRAPYDLFSALVTGVSVDSRDETTTHAAHLLAALRIIAEPSAGVERPFLYTRAATALGALAARSPDGLVALHHAAAEYGRQVEEWA